MSQRVFIQSAKSGVKYYLKSFDPETKVAILVGRYGADFEVKPFTKEKIEADGYTLHTEEVEDAKPQGIQA